MIFKTLPILLLFVFSLFLCGCRKSAETAAPSTSPPPTAPKVHGLEACSLITKEEVGAIQAATILNAQASESNDGSYLVSLCYYGSQEPNMSVSIALTQTDPNNPAKSSPRTYWASTFDRSKEDDEEKTHSREREKEEHESTPPKQVAGVGEAAYWIGNAVGGALYVLQKDVIIRVSVGGPNDEQLKIDKSKALAAKALSHL